MSEGGPYLSVVVTARNDDHGGNLLRRMQIFVNGWIAQCKRHGLSSELIVVDWNPPGERPPLMEALQWPADLGPCDVRFIQVPPELHHRYQHESALPLYQMIAKNVGIRRSRGRFILATNIDILFSDELMAFLAERRLEPGHMYRIDRHDAMSDVPLEATLDEQLEYCRTHLLRVNAREGTFPLTPDGQLALASCDIAAAGSGISLGRGWFPVEKHTDGEMFRWIGNDAELQVTFPPGPRSLRLDLEPGPGMGQRLMVLRVFDGPHEIANVEVDRRSELILHFPRLDSAEHHLRLEVIGGGEPVEHDPRLLNCRVFSVASERERSRSHEVAARRVPLGFWKRLLRWWNLGQALLNRLATSGPLLTVTIPVSGPVRRAAAFYVGWGGVTGMLRNVLGRALQTLHLRDSRPAQRPLQVRPAPLSPPLVFLHTNACGDFTMAAREHWFDLRGYPEFDLYSMNIDSVFCYAAHHGGAREETLADPMRIYHIEHGTGSGWTPEGQAALFERLAAKGVSFIPYQELVGWAAQMRRLNCPIIFNSENWGLAEFELPEHRPKLASGAGSAQPPVRCAAESV
jgi:hypothetical protein